MKLSEMNTDQAFEVMGNIAIPLSNICDNPNAMAKIEELIKTANASLQVKLKQKKYSEYYSKLGMGDKLVEMAKQVEVSASAGKILSFVGALMKTNKNDTFEIVSALSDKTVKELKELSFAEFMAVAKNCIDSDLLSFFKSSAATETTE